MVTFYYSLLYTIYNGYHIFPLKFLRKDLLNMSKLYKNYVSLKVQDCSKYYLFKCGLFFIFLDEDARTMSSVLGLKLTNLTPTIQKCGFPCNSLEKYLNLLENTPYNIHIVSSEDLYISTPAANYFANKELEKILNDFIEVDIDTLSISEAFDLLYELQKKFRKIKGL